MQRHLASLLTLIFLVGTILANGASPPLKVCFVSGSNEYHSEVSLVAFKEYLEAHTNSQVEILQAKGPINQYNEYSKLPDLKPLEQSDVALFFTRRVTIEGEALERIRKYCESGRPLVALRTACHGFQNWLEFDRTVLGCNYQNHYPAGPMMESTVPADAKDHPILDGADPIRSKSSLYKVEPLAADARVLMTGSIPEGTQPIAWTRAYRGGRIFFTSLGSQDDFESRSFRRMLANALFWAAKRTPEWK